MISPSFRSPTILRVFAIFLEPEHPLRFSADELRSFFADKVAEYTALHKNNTSAFIHRYPVLQCKQIKNSVLVIGISQGADCLVGLSRDQMILGRGESICRITSRDTAIREEVFGIADSLFTYEFLTPWLALNQQYAKKFYDLKGKAERDAFMQKLLTTHLQTLARSLDYPLPEAVTCTAHVRFERERIAGENVIVFRGKFQTNLRIPDYLGIGRSVSKGYGTIREIPVMPASGPENFSGS